jgi:hypothetical protein
LSNTVRDLAVITEAVASDGSASRVIDRPSYASSLPIDRAALVTARKSVSQTLDAHNYPKMNRRK